MTEQAEILQERAFTISHEFYRIKQGPALKKAKPMLLLWRILPRKFCAKVSQVSVKILRIYKNDKILVHVLSMILHFSEEKRSFRYTGF